MIEEKNSRLSELYNNIYVCSKCVGSTGCKITRDSYKIPRLVVKESLTSKIFLIGQALGEQTQRLSGIPYTKTNGELSQTGKRLDKFLQLIGYTINSTNQDNGLKMAYSTDIIQCYPGKKETGNDRHPQANEIVNCINQGFLFQEIETINPSLILLMGKTSRDTFYQYYISNLRVPIPLSEHITQIANDGKLQSKKFGNKEILILPIQHPSGVNPKFQEMLNNKKLINMIKEILL